MRRLEVLVIRGELQRHVEAVPPWEVPILELVHRGQIEIVGESECSAPIPSPEQEYERLRQKYRQNKETLIPRVEEVYGAGSMGVRALGEAIARESAPLPFGTARGSGESAEPGEEEAETRERRRRTA